ncbi:MAG: hypothetical protein HQL66_15080 [Magnetococcales bacterium]|nr:hypothetical protein [Magnetococcales bacterium]
MRMAKWILAWLLLGIVVAGDGHAEWRHHRSRVDVVIGAPYWGPYPYSYYYYPPPVIVERPPVYIQQQPVVITAPPPAPVASAPAASEGQFWYYCTAAKGYYPYVKECPGGWRKVSPRPPDQP